jgi:hypothetical protein
MYVYISRFLCIFIYLYIGVNLRMGPKARFFILSDRCGFVDVGRSLCREDGPVTAAEVSSTCHLYLQFYTSAFYTVICPGSGSRGYLLFTVHL